MPEQAERFIDPEHQPPYHDIPELVGMIEPPYRDACLRLVDDHGDRMRAASGSSHNHQPWEGGYWDHIRDCMNLASVYHDVDSSLRPLPFSKSDALLIMFLHDLEKPWRYEWRDGEKVRNEALRSKADKKAFRDGLLAEYGIELTPELQNAMTYVEGELADYSNERRVMGPLAAFCHAIDVKSARMWFDHPQSDDAWAGAERVTDGSG
ncbi:MAG: hypothetical protein WD603_02285 [Patescibacteria group bacterium]